MWNLFKSLRESVSESKMVDHAIGHHYVAMFLNESDLPVEKEKAIQASVGELNLEQSLREIEGLHAKLDAGSTSPEEGAKYHFLKMHIKKLGGKVPFKTHNVRVLSDYGRMKNKTDYTKKPLPKNLVYSKGNSKLGKDTMIFNMGAAIDCPSRKLGMCQVCLGKGVCYALKAEVQYQGDKSSAIRKRRTQGQQWKKFSVENLAGQMASAIEKYGIKYVRINESGDLADQSDVEKISQLADLLKGKAVVYMYTARKDLNFKKVSKNLVINGSGFKVHNDFHFVPKADFDKIPGDAKVCGGDCPNCTLCKTRGGETIYAKQH